MGVLRVGAIGLGWVSCARHLPSLLLNPDVRLEAVCDWDGGRAAAVARRFGVPSVFTSPERMLAQDLDLVCIGTPPWSHAELSRLASTAGCHVFCEKPMALNRSDAESMVGAARQANRLLCISHNFLFSRSLAQADATLGGATPVYVLGVQLSSSTRRLPDWYEELPGGLLLDESPHLLYVLSHYCGSPLRLVSARANRGERSRWPSSIELLLQGSRAAGQVTMVFDSPVSEWHVGVVTDSRVVGIDLFRDICTAVGSDHRHRAVDIAKTSLKVMGDQATGYLRSGMRLASKRQFWGHDVIISRFVDACLGRGEVPIDLTEATSIVALTDTIVDELGLQMV